MYSLYYLFFWENPWGSSFMDLFSFPSANILIKFVLGPSMKDWKGDKRGIFLSRLKHGPND
jgi:hypothetical protein